MKKALTDKQIKDAFSRRVAPLLAGMENCSNNDERGKVFGVSGPTISRWSSGKDMPEMTKCCALADYFNISVDWLLLGRDPTKQTKNTPPPTIQEVYPELGEDVVLSIEALVDSFLDQKARKR